MPDTEEVIAALRAALIPQPIASNLIAEELERVRAENAMLNHMLKVLRCENSGLYAKLELLDAKSEGGCHHDSKFVRT